MCGSTNSSPARDPSLRSDDKRRHMPRTLGLIMNGVSGRMGVNQHLIRSVLAIRKQGGVPMSDGSRVMLDPVLVSRSADKVKALAEQHGGLRWSTDLDAAIKNPKN